MKAGAKGSSPRVPVPGFESPLCLSGQVILLVERPPGVVVVQVHRPSRDIVSLVHPGFHHDRQIPTVPVVRTEK